MLKRDRTSLNKNSKRKYNLFLMTGDCRQPIMCVVCIGIAIGYSLYKYVYAHFWIVWSTNLQSPVPFTVLRAYHFFFFMSLLSRWFVQFVLQSEIRLNINFVYKVNIQLWKSTGLVEIAFHLTVGWGTGPFTGGVVVGTTFCGGGGCELATGIAGCRVAAGLVRVLVDSGFVFFFFFLLAVKRLCTRNEVYQ